MKSQKGKLDLVVFIKNSVLYARFSIFVVEFIVEEIALQVGHIARVSCCGSR